MEREYRIENNRLNKEAKKIMRTEDYSKFKELQTIIRNHVHDKEKQEMTRNLMMKKVIEDYQQDSDFTGFNDLEAYVINNIKTLERAEEQEVKKEKIKAVTSSLFILLAFKIILDLIQASDKNGIKNWRTHFSLGDLLVITSVSFLSAFVVSGVGKNYDEKTGKKRLIFAFVLTMLISVLSLILPQAQVVLISFHPIILVVFAFVFKVIINHFLL